MISIVVDLGYGDSGKGVVTDSLSHSSALVVRFSGGHQAGHTVIRNGIKHIHSSFGSGTLAGADTYLSHHVVFFPTAMVREMEALIQKGVRPNPIYVHPLAPITTPFDILYGRNLEAYAQHGSCGLGVGYTMKRHLETPYKLTAIDLTHPKLFKEKYASIQYYYKQLGLEIPHDFCPTFEEDCMNYSRYLRIADYSFLTKYRRELVFEGSQGIMLDMDHGVFPHVTYSNTTSKNAFEILKLIDARQPIDVHYVTRCYQTRHGNGPMTSEIPISLINNVHEINVFDQYQGVFRVAEIDYELLNYAIQIDQCYHPQSNINKRLVVTCLDQRPDSNFEFDNFKGPVYGNYSPEYGHIKKIK